MKLSHIVRLSCSFVPVIILTLLAGSPALGGQYFQDFSAFSVGATTFGDGSALFSDQLGTVASVQDGTYKELALTESGTGNTHSAFLLPDLDPGAPVYAFSAKWNSQVYGNFPAAADGFSFTFGQVGSLNLASSGYNQEAGYGTGICFSVQTYPGNNPGFYLRVNGATIASQPYSSGVQWGANNTTRHFFEVDWNYAYGVSVRMDGQTIFTNVPTPGLTFQAGDRFVWAARCGSESEEVRLDNIIVATGGNLAPVSTTAPYYADPYMALPPPYAFDGNPNTAWGDFNVLTSPTGFVGATVSPSSVVGAYALVSPPSEAFLAGAASSPASWILQGSDDGVNWVSCGTGSGPFVNSLETRCWMATNSTYFNAYRLDVPTGNGQVGLGLAELRFYQFIPVVTPGAWVQSSSGSGRWQALSCSADGMKIVAAQYSDLGISASVDGGQTWFATGAPAGEWLGVASSANGKQVAAVSAYANNVLVNVPGGIYLSSDYGSNWTLSAGTAGVTWSSIASSADGTRLVASQNGQSGGVYLSSDSGAHWAQSGAPAGNWNGVASSSDGKILIACGGPGICVSTNFGTSWLRSETSDPFWQSAALSTNGSVLAAASRSGDGLAGDGVYVSTDLGSTWTQTKTGNFQSVACSANGSIMGLAGNYDVIYMSNDGGHTWTAGGAPYESWNSITCSSDGSRMAGGFWFSGVWTYGPVTPLAPAAATTNASLVEITSAHLNGQGTANFLPTTVWFQWGLTTSYGNSSSAQAIGNGNGAVPVSTTIAGLSPATIYHYRAVALNSFGTNFGADMTFTTVPADAFFNVTQPGDTIAATSANSPAGQGVAMAIDETASSKYLNFDITNTGFTVFPSITNIPVQAVGLISAEDSPERDPASFVLYGSFDGTNFALITSNSVPLFAARSAIQSFSFPNTNAYAAYKIIFPTVAIPTNANSMQIAEVELLPYADITSTNDSLRLSLPSGASLAGTTPAAALLDRQLGQDTNKMDVLNDSNNVVAFITPAAGATIVKGVELVGGDDDASYPGREPSTVTLEGSNDGTNYSTLLFFNPTVPIANMQIQGYSILTNNTAYSQYRATFGVPQSGNILQIGELRLFGLARTTLAFTNSGSNLAFSWPASAYYLQQSTDLVNWFTATNSITVNNGRNQMTVPLSTGKAFYRLKSQ